MFDAVMEIKYYVLNRWTSLITRIIQGPELIAWHQFLENV